MCECWLTVGSVRVTSAHPGSQEHKTHPAQHPQPAQTGDYPTGRSAGVGTVCRSILSHSTPFPLKTILQSPWGGKEEVWILGFLSLSEN